MPGNREKRRLLLFMSILAAAVVVIVVRLAQLMIFDAGAQTEGALGLPTVERGPILDRNGKILAISTRLASVSAWIPNVSQPEQTARSLAEVLAVPEEALLRRLREGAGFVYLARKITPTQTQKLEELIAAGKLPGIDLVPEYGRNYPEQNLASHVLGYVGVDNIGLEGVEYSFNNVLSPPAVSLERNHEELYGNQVFLTLDVNVQYFLETIAAGAHAANRADAVYVLVMEARTGEILGYCAIPNFDPNQYNRFDATALQNLPLTRAYEPGSVFKIVSIASFLQLGGIDEATEFYCDGVYEMPLPDGGSIRIRDLSSHGRVNAQRILQFSCNVGAALASETVTADSFHDMLVKFGFGRPTDLPLPGESAGILAPPSRWSSRSKPTIAFGQEISVSTIQMLQAATVFADGGTLLKPQIVKKIVSPQGEVLKEYGREPLREVLSPRTARSVLQMMESATQPTGTARRGQIPGVRVAAKTGTAEVRDPVTGGYSETHFVASYLGIFPVEDPRLIVYVVIDHPRGSEYYGSQIAAPVFREVGQQLVEYYGIPTEEERVVEHPGQVEITLPEGHDGPLEAGTPMPELIGLAKRQLLPLLREGGLEVRVLGEGHVVAQDPPAGTPLSAGMTVTLRLE
ncbi:MAG: transpeptidase family protein [Spirochaetales bacterium]|nr:transpeptidase family protein [Spirochaetales bacterium]